MGADDVALGIAATLTIGTVCTLIYMIFKGERSE